METTIKTRKTQTSIIFLMIILINFEFICIYYFYHTKNIIQFKIKQKFQIKLKEEKKTKDKKLKKGVALCAIAKEEKNYIKEFIEWYKSIGFTHIFLYDNNDINGEFYYELLSSYIKSNFLEIIDYRGIINAQIPAYKDCKKKNLINYDWLAFFDIDEFLFIQNPNITIDDFLSQKKFEKCDYIKINWKIYGDNDLLHYEDNLVQKRFTKANYDKLFWQSVKSIIRTNTSLQFDGPHQLKPYKHSCKTDGKFTRYWGPHYDDIHLRHYMTKTAEEYCQKRFRGSPMRITDKESWLNKNLELFWRFNKKTKEKLKIFKGCFDSLKKAKKLII